MSQTNLFRSSRIRLVALGEEDAEAFARWSEDAEYLRNLDTDYAVPRSANYFRSEIEANASSHNGLEFGIRTIEDDRLIGFVSLHSIEWNNRAGRLAVGIGERDYRGKGYGTEVLQLILRYAFDELNLNRVGLDVIGNNKAAIRCYEKSGFVVEGVVREGVIRDGQKQDRIYMGILKSEWESYN